MPPPLPPAFEAAIQDARPLDDDEEALADAVFEAVLAEFEAEERERAALNPARSPPPPRSGS